MSVFFVHTQSLSSKYKLINFTHVGEAILLFKEVKTVEILHKFVLKLLIEIRVLHSTVKLCRNLHMMVVICKLNRNS